MARPSRKSNPGSGPETDTGVGSNRGSACDAGEQTSGASGGTPLHISGDGRTSAAKPGATRAKPPVLTSDDDSNATGDDAGRGPDRRASNRGGPSGLERRRGPGRRLSDFSRAAEEGELNREQFLFLMAIEEFKRANGKPYPSWTDVVEVVRLLGYRKTMSSMLHLPRAEDWREPPNAKAGVRPDKWTTRFSDDEMRALSEGLDDLDARNSAEAA